MTASRRTRIWVSVVRVLCAAMATGALVGGYIAFANLSTGNQATPSSSWVRNQSSQNPRIAKEKRRSEAVLIAAGDIASCDSRADSDTAALVRAIRGTVATLGDHVYEMGSKQEFANCYDPTWGAVRNRTRPAAGNHEYETPGARAFFDYFGAAAVSAATATTVTILAPGT